MSHVGNLLHYIEEIYSLGSIKSKLISNQRLCYVKIIDSVSSNLK